MKKIQAERGELSIERFEEEKRKVNARIDDLEFQLTAHLEPDFDDDTDELEDDEEV
jgi:hypothetical protein